MSKSSKNSKNLKNIINIKAKHNTIIDLELQIATDAQTLPHPAQFKSWVGIILTDILELDYYNNSENIELSIRIVDEEEITDLNYRYRNKNQVTNVLSFPVEIMEELDYQLLGDIIICASKVEEEAGQQKKELLAHWAHMVVHGVLHLFGFDHQNEAEANEMETIEINIMKKLGFSSPYSLLY